MLVTIDNQCTLCSRNSEIQMIIKCMCVSFRQTRVLYMWATGDIERKNKRGPFLISYDC